MDSRSYPPRDNRAAQRLLDAVSGVLARECGDGLQATCDVYICDGTGRQFARCRISALGHDSWKILVGQEPAEGGPTPAANSFEVGNDSE